MSWSPSERLLEPCPTIAPFWSIPTILSPACGGRPESGGALRVGGGTRLATGYDQPALGGVYKLSAIRGQDGRWSHRVKLSEQVIKVSLPGLLQVRRYQNAGGFCGDMIFSQDCSPTGDCQMIDPLD